MERKKTAACAAAALLAMAGAAWAAMKPEAGAAAAPAGADGGADGGAEFTVLQWNIWQEGTVVPGGYDAIVAEIARLRPDFVTLSEVRNYRGTRFHERIAASLKAKGLDYFSFYSKDSGLLSRHPIAAASTVFPEKGDHGSVYRLASAVCGRKVAVYTAHLDYRDCAYYNARGYDGSTWRECPLPKSAEELLARNVKSQRDDAIRAFLAAAEKDLADGRAVLLGGDFNEPSHRDWTAASANLFDHHGLAVPWTCTSLLEKAGFTDAYRKIHPDPLTHPGFTFPSDNPAMAVKKLTWAPKADERDRIDFIFYRGAGLEAREISLFGPKTSIVRSRRVKETGRDPFILPLGVWPTDHKGLFARFRFTP